MKFNKEDIETLSEVLAYQLPSLPYSKWKITGCEAKGSITTKLNGVSIKITKDSGLEGKPGWDEVEYEDYRLFVDGYDVTDEITYSNKSNKELNKSSIYDWVFRDKYEADQRKKEEKEDKLRKNFSGIVKKLKP